MRTRSASARKVRYCTRTRVSRAEGRGRQSWPGVHGALRWPPTLRTSRLPKFLYHHCHLCSGLLSRLRRVTHASIPSLTPCGTRRAASRRTGSLLRFLAAGFGNRGSRGRRITRAAAGGGLGREPQGTRAESATPGFASSEACHFTGEWHLRDIASTTHFGDRLPPNRRLSMCATLVSLGVC